MNCRQVEKLLSAQRDGTDIARWMPAMDAHRRQCGRCATAPQEFESIGNLLADLHASSENMPSRAAAQAAITNWQLRSRTEQRPWFIRPAWAAVCLGIVALGAAGLLLKANFLSTVSSPPVPSKSQVVASSSGGASVNKNAPRNSDRKHRPEFGTTPSTPLRQHGDIPQIVDLRGIQNNSERPAGVQPASISAPVDDLAFLHRGVELSMARWAKLRPDETEKIQREIDRTIKTGDSFVTVPFPRIAGTAASSLAAASRAYQQEKEVIDPRLARKLTLSTKGQAFADLCAQWTAQTGIEFTAGRTVADDKVTIFCKDKPLRDLMRQITQVFGFRWKRGGEPGKYQYELYQDLRAQLTEEELRNRDRNEALIALDKEMQRFAKFANLSPEEAKAMAETASPEDKELLTKLAGPGWAAVHLYGSLSQDQLNTLRNGGTVSFSSSPQAGEGSIPPDIHKGTMSSMRDARIYRDDKGNPNGLSVGGDPTDTHPYSSPKEFPQARSKADLQLNFTDLGQIEMNGGGGFHLPTTDDPNSGMGCMVGDTLAIGISPSVRDPKNAEANSKLASDPALRGKVTIEPQKAGILPAREDNPRADSGARCTSAEVWQALHEATGMDIVADYYTRLYVPSSVTVRDITLFSALNQLCDRMRIRWTRQEGWLQFRGTSFFNDRLKEVPNRLLTKWAEVQKRTGHLSPEDLMEIAQLTDAQLDAKTSEEGARTLFGLEDWRQAAVVNLRTGWRFLAGLPSPLRQSAWSDSGVTYRQLPLSQQSKFIGLVFSSETDRSRATLEDIAPASLRVEKVDSANRTPNSSYHTGYKFIYRYGGGALERYRREVSANGTSSNSERAPHP